LSLRPIEAGPAALALALVSLSGPVTGLKPGRHIRHRIITIVTFTSNSAAWLSAGETTD